MKKNITNKLFNQKLNNKKMKTKLNFLSKLVILFLMFTTTVFSQNITNTLGTNGLFTIKDASNNYLTLSQSTGQVNILKTLRLENTTSSSLGIIFKGADRFLHNYGTNNTFLGINSGNFTMTGINNTALGYTSLFFNTTGTQNTALGYKSLFHNTTGSQNTALGYQSLIANTTGDSNTALGNQSLVFNTTGTNNIALGLEALYSNSSGSSNIALGNHSLYFNTIGNRNTALGFQSLPQNTTGSFNTALGYQSLRINTTGTQNTALGYTSLYSNTNGNFNTALGLNSLYSNTSGDLNTALGYSSGSTIIDGNNLTLIGNDAEPTFGSATNQITLGNNQVTSLRCNVQTITSLSDMRDKKNITDLSLGLDFLMKVKPRLFNWDKREWYDNNISDGTKIQETPTAGFIAQELDEVQTTENAEWLNLVLKDNPEKLEATSGNLLPVMVKAIQELKVESEKLKVENIQLKNENSEILQRLSNFEHRQNIFVSELKKLTSFNKAIENKIISKIGDIK